MKNVSYKTEKAGGGASPQAAAPRLHRLWRLLAAALLLAALPFGATAQTTTIYSQNFNSTPENSLPEGWESSPNGKFYVQYSHTNKSYTLFSKTLNSMVLMPNNIAIAGNWLQFEFVAFQHNRISVGYWDGTSFTPLRTISCGNTSVYGPELHTVRFPNSVPTNARIAIKVLNSEYSSSYASATLDNFRVFFYNFNDTSVNIPYEANFSGYSDLDDFIPNYWFRMSGQSSISNGKMVFDGRLLLPKFNTQIPGGNFWVTISGNCSFGYITLNDLKFHGFSSYGNSTDDKTFQVANLPDDARLAVIDGSLTSIKVFHPSLLPNQTVNLPYTQNFNSVANGQMPNGWLSANGGTKVKGQRLELIETSESHNDVVLLPYINGLQSLNGLWMDLTYTSNSHVYHGWGGSYYYHSHLQVGYLTYADDPSSFVPLKTVTDEGTQTVHVLYSGVPSGARLAIKGKNCFIDDVRISSPIAMPCYEPFNGNIWPEAWNTYIGQLQWDGNVGTAELTASSLSWRVGDPTSPFDSHAFAELKSENSYKWLVSPPIVIDDIDDAYLRVSLALSRPWGPAVVPGMQDNQSLGIYVADENGATWHKLLTFANNGGDLPLEAITVQGVQHALNLADFRGKTVKFGFYAATAEGDNHNVIHLDNFAVEQRNHSQAPTSVAVSEVAGRSAKVSWQAANALQSEWDVWVTNHTDISSPYSDYYLEQSGILTHLNTLNKEYVVEGLTPNTGYEAWVRYNDGHVTSPWTCSQYFETVPMCNEPTNIVVETTPTTVFVSWEPGQANQTRWTVGLGGSDLWEYTTTETSILIDVEGMIEPGETFRVYITGYCEDGDGNITTEVAATMQPWPSLTLNEGHSQDNDIVPITPASLPRSESETQFIIPASQLVDMQYSTINQITFYDNYWNNCAPWGENVWFRVRVMEVPKANFNGTQSPEDQFYEYNDNPGFTTYYHGKLRLDSEGMMHIPLGSLGFHYTNANLLVGIKQDTDDVGTYYAANWLGSSTQDYQSMYVPEGGDPEVARFAPQVTFSYRPDTYQPPTNLVAQYASPREVYYTWTPRPGQDKVRIQIADNPSFTSAQTKTATGDQYTALYSTALTPGATYYVRAKTLFIDPENGQTKESPWGPTVEMLVPDICDSPTNLAATEVGPFSAKLEWTSDAFCEVEYRDLANETSQVMWTCGFEDAQEYINLGWSQWTDDGVQWQRIHQGTGFNAISVMGSTITGTQGLHSHWLVTKEVELPGRICFYVAGRKNERLSVYVSTNGKVKANFEKVYSYTFTSNVLPTDPEFIEVDLSDFEGYGYIAFVHEKIVFDQHTGTPPTYSVFIDNVRYLENTFSWQSYGATSQGWAVVDGRLTPGHTYKARVRATCEGSYSGYSDWCYSAEFTANPYIDFDDPDVEAVCAAAWGSNGKLTYAQAAAVESLGEVFRGNTDVNTFYELRYFTGLSDISDYAFYGCTNLEAISMPDQITSIGMYAFGYCESLTYVNFRNPIESIEVCAFRGSGLYHIYFPLHLTYLGNLAFGECNNLETVYLPASVISMDGNPFAYCKNLENIFVHDANPVFDSRDNCNAIVHTETNKLVSGCKTTVIPETVTTIGQLAFGGAGITDFTIPETVGHIDHSAFAFCNNLATLTVLATNPPTMGMNVFEGVDNFRILVPCETVETYQGAEGWSDFASIISGFDCPAVLHIEAYTNDTDGWYLITSPLFYDVSPEEVVNMTSNEFDLYAFEGNYEQAEWRNYKNNENNGFYMLRSGMGYLYANSSNVDLEFHGQTIEGDTFGIGLNRNDETKFGNWNLVGNPFLTEATVSVSDYYRIDEGTRRLMLSNGSVSAMEGIFVEANDNLTNIDFTKLTRGSRGERAIESPMVNIDLRNAEGHLLDRARLRMGEGNNLSKLDMLSDPNRLYFRIDGKDYAVARVNGQGEMPLHFDAAQNGTFALNVNVEGMEMAYLHLIDNMTGEDVDLLAQNGGDARHCVSTYTFTGKPSDYASRFRLVFETGSSAEGDSFAFVDAAGNIVITNTEAGATLQVIDVTGRVVVSVGGHTRCVPTTGIPAGVYVLRLINGNDVMTQKIVVE